MLQKQVTHIVYPKYLLFLCEIVKYCFLLYYNADIFNMRVFMFNITLQSHKERLVLKLHIEKHVIQDKQ